jgi:hypothetical protein
MSPAHSLPIAVLLDMNDRTLLFDRDDGLPDMPELEQEKSEEEDDKKAKYAS